MEIKNDDIDRIVDEIRKVSKTLQVVILNLPVIDTTNPTVHEKYILENHSNSDQMLEIINKTSSIPHEFETFDYQPDDLVDILSPPEQMVIDNKLFLSDRYGKRVNIRNGARVTTNQPNEYAQTIWFVGGCRIYGFGAEDEATIESYLQEMIQKKTQFKYLVENYGQLYGGGGKKYMLFHQIKDILTKQIKENDILIIGGNFNPKKPKCHFIDTQKYFSKPYKFGEVFFEERLPHLNKNGNHLVAECLFDFLMSKKLLTATTVTQIRSEEDQIVSAHPVLKDDQFMSQLEEYKKYISSFKQDGKCGGICMNANPFTNGHSYLVETASKMVDHLFIFVAEENITMFPFKARFQMIKDGVSDFPNVTVIQGGIFVGSVITFPEYYDREVKKDIKILPSLDLLIFADHLCPTLNITIRFVGTEPLCPVTDQFNTQLRTILPKKGIELYVIPRKEISDKVVSASYVRAILKQWEEGNYAEYDLTRLQELVPPTTFRYIEKKYSFIFPKDNSSVH